MIESRFWKEELLRISRPLGPKRKPVRWSERQHCVIERDVMIGFFLLRRMMDLRRVSRTFASRTVRVYALPRRAKLVTKRNHWDIDNVYDAGTARPLEMTSRNLANHFLHAYTSFVLRDEERRWSHLLVVSDNERNNHVLRVPLDVIYGLFVTAASNYPSTLTLSWNPQRRDYDEVAED